MANFSDPNPYAPPSLASQSVGPQQPLRNKVMAPAIALLVTGVLGIVMSVFNVVYAFTTPEVDPNLPPFLQELQKGGTGTAAAITQGLFVLLNAFIILGGAQMLRMRTWGVAVAASILALVNIGSCCCVLGLPVGIWSLVILFMPDVTAAFAMNSRAY